MPHSTVGQQGLNENWHWSMLFNVGACLSPICLKFGQTVPDDLLKATYKWEFRQGSPETESKVQKN